eukprot:CAMPEP_0174702082 /NCGR_PEP_ID=MMETSP1094-20130205/6491_1 /TAXON_ID=156173 /ORGANISM="Chrysochromulina brevifilum, Strain UTEX LB 985" /LENGTH=103 /DNA_ID=CAMNT_0015899811 /DNA_START=1452 /DNA_END=1763 /DNA_ORIENTATION=+
MCESFSDISVRHFMGDTFEIVRTNANNGGIEQWRSWQACGKSSSGGLAPRVVSLAIWGNRKRELQLQAAAAACGLPAHWVHSLGPTRAVHELPAVINGLARIG